MSYQYKPLYARQIRLLKLFPSLDDFNDATLREIKIKCELEIVSLDQDPGFEALSYVWGSSEDRVPVELSGREIFVTKNLKNALRYIRKRVDPIWMWADAICINQQDNKEKEVQVQMMRDIYRTAKIVTVFLGSGTDKSLSLIGEINRIGDKAIAAGIHSLKDKELMDLLNNRIDNSSSEVKRAVLELADQAGRDFPWEAYNEFTKYDYWKRVWVFQEFCITAECRIMLGHNETDFETFAGAHILLSVMIGRTLDLLTEENVDLGIKVSKGRKRVSENDQVSNPNNVTEETNLLITFAEKSNLKVIDSQDWEQQIKFNTTLIQAISTSEKSRIMSMIGARKGYRTKTGNRTLIRLLERCYVIGSSPSNREATHPRDKIYGLLGLATDVEDLGITPNYRNLHSEMETARILTDVTSRLLGSGYIDILAWCQWPKSIEHLPSWVPDFGVINEPCSQTKADKIFSASGDSELTWIELPERRFSIRGTKVDEIRALGNPWMPDNIGDPMEQSTVERLLINTELYEYLRSASLFSEFAKSEYRGLVPITADQWKEADWRVPCGDQLWLGNNRKRATNAGFDSHRTLSKEILLYQSIILHETRQEQDLPTLIPGVPLDKQIEEFSGLLRSEERRQYRVALDRQHNRRPFLSQQGYMGLAPAHAKEGDLVAILFGAVQPFVLRRRGQRYALVGEAYVYGIMDGEFLNTNPPKEDFELV